MLRILRNRPTLLALPLALALTACQGTRTSGDHGSVYATSFNIVGFQLPFDDYAQAHSMVPAGADVETVVTHPRDWTSFLGILTSIIGFSSTQIGYVAEND